MMLVDYTEMSSRKATAVAKLMEVYAEHFQGRTSTSQRMA